jgi:23S rRNA pseudouridine955/2504/2580 synthase
MIGSVVLSVSALFRPLAGAYRRMSETARVEKDEAGLRLDRWFKRHYPGLGHGPLEKLLRTGQVRIDGKRAQAGDRLEPGQSIRIPPQLQSQKDQPAAPRPCPSAMPTGNSWRASSSTKTLPSLC